MLAELVIELTGKPLQDRFPSAAVGRSASSASPTSAKAEKLLGWRPEGPLQRRAGQTIAYFDALLSQSDDTFAGPMPLNAPQADWPRVANMD